MNIPSFSHRVLVVGLLGMLGYASGCDRPSPHGDGTGGGGNSSPGGATATSSGGAAMGEGGADAQGGQTTGNGGGSTAVEPTPKYYPVPGFEDCIHVEVKADCENG